MFVFDSANVTPLCKIMKEFNTDKGKEFHNYSPVYYTLLKHRKCVNVFEMGIGHVNNDFICNMSFMPNYHSGSSLRAWRSFFPDAVIYGADIYEEAVKDARSEQIITFQCNQLNACQIVETFEFLPLFDLMIDDGYHNFYANACLFEKSVHKLKNDGLYIIEDINTYEIPKFKERIVLWKQKYPQYEFWILDIPKCSGKHDIDNCIVVIELNLSNDPTNEITILLKSLEVFSCVV